MQIKTKGDLVIDFLAKCKELEEREASFAAMEKEVNAIEKAIRLDSELMDAIKGGGLSYGSSVVRYESEMDMLRIDQVKPATSIESLLVVEPSEALSE